MGVVIEAWARIEDWLDRFAPISAAVLASPADRDEIAAAEAALGLALPPELVDSLCCHNGLIEWANILPKGPLLSVAGIVEQYQERMDIAEDVDGFTPHGPDAQPWWHELWLPFAASDGDLQVIDQRPGPGFARVGEAPHDNPGDFSQAWPSLGAYLANVADALETGGAVGAWNPYLNVRDELWWDLAGATELNGEPLRAAPASAS
jgi:cell wall assembly regulator SMI1